MNCSCIIISSEGRVVFTYERRVPKSPAGKFAMPSSFKKNTHLAPVRYRTPSPPRQAFEPISPILSGIVADDLQRANPLRHHNESLKRPHLPCDYSDLSAREQKTLLRGPMDVFASIALATKSDGRHGSSPSTRAQFIDDGYHEIDRPAKRAKLDMSPLLDRSSLKMRVDRAATSYEQSSKCRRHEAELLLNFAHEAAKLMYSRQESPEAENILPFRVSLTSSKVPLASTHQSSQGRTRDFNGNKAFNGEGDIDQADLQTSSFGERVVLEKRPVSEAESRQEKHLDQPMSDHFARQSQCTTNERFEIEKQFLSPIESLNSSNLGIPPEALNQNSNNTRTEVFDRSKVEDCIGSLDPNVVHEKQGSIAFEDQNLSCVTDVDEDSHSDISPKERYHIMNTVREGTTQLINNAKNVIQASKLQEGMACEEIEDPKDLEGLEQAQEEVPHHESCTAHAAPEDQASSMDEILAAEAGNTKQSTREVSAISTSASDVSVAGSQARLAIATSAVCASCNFSRNSSAIENDNYATSWISCDGCKAWFHFACAGFKNDREVRSVDKYRCRKCKPLYGSTTYVRKSSRAHSAIDYAGLHQGVIKTSDERPEHHYIKPIKDGTITFLPEKFARMRPELVTSEYFEKGTGMREPIVIPACLNPRPKMNGAPIAAAARQTNDTSSPDPIEGNGVTEDWFSRHTEPEVVMEQGQDALDMVIPQGLTVRRVAELYGQDEKVEVIDVKSQNGENKKWNMRRWADYYENPNNKVVRNVISLEVSQSKLGRLIRRPQIVRDLDLQDSVWPEELLSKGEYPRVQFYCLMSVADCFTDFHIDFGGSSVFYHIVKGKKTFLFIPPKERYLKKYEEWCMSPAQNWTFLGDQTKECYRVDLSEGDTMLIPAGWIHAVWTPEDSLVIGGNFLTRLNFGMQLRVAQVEKATGVARKFRYPHFQKLHWYTALRYLEDDPLPKSVRELLHAGGNFGRQQPAYNEFDSWGENSRPGVENYHTRYYSQSELDGLPELTRYLLRTALIDIGSITDGISAETRNAVKKSIPRGHGEPLDVLKTFATWCAWKRGNEPIPHWAYPDAEPETIAPDKLSAAAMKKLDREAAFQAPRRQSARMQSQQAASETLSGSLRGAAPLFAQGQNAATHADTGKKFSELSRRTIGTSQRKTACDSCRKRRRACKHKDQAALSTPSHEKDTLESLSTDLSTALQKPALLLGLGPNDRQGSNVLAISNSRTPELHDQDLGIVPDLSSSTHCDDRLSYRPTERACSKLFNDKAEDSLLAATDTGHSSTFGNTMPVRPRHKACNECRKSKVSLDSIIFYLVITYACTASLHTR